MSDTPDSPPDQPNAAPLPAADVATLLERVRQEVRANRSRLAQHEETGSSALVRELQRCAEELELTRVVSAHWPLESSTPLERGVLFVQKVLRRGLRWYINPIVEQQNAFNDTTARTLRLLIEAYGNLHTDLAHLRTRQSEQLDPPDTPDPPAGDAATG